MPSLCLDGRRAYGQHTRRLRRAIIAHHLNAIPKELAVRFRLRLPRVLFLFVTPGLAVGFAVAFFALLFARPAAALLASSTWPALAKASLATDGARRMQGNRIKIADRE